MSFTLLGILNSQALGSGVSYWLATLGGASYEVGKSTAVDSSGNLYAFGYTASTGAGGSDFLLAKYDSAGAVQWQRVLGGTGSEVANSVAIDSSDNVYVLGYTDSAGAGTTDLLLAKYNSSGTIQYQRVLGGTATDRGWSVAIDSSDNVYVLGLTASEGAGGGDVLLAKYNSAGTFQWQRILGGSGEDDGFSVAIDSSDNVYVLGDTNSEGAGNDDFLLAKYNSSGTIQWQRVLGGSNYDRGKSVTIDSSDNVYVTGETYSEGAGLADFLLAKYNSSGTIQWQRVLGGTGSEGANSVAIDSSDNVYVLGGTNSEDADGLDFLFSKYNSSGTIQWQRILGGSGNEAGNSVAIDSSDNLYVFGNTPSTGAGAADFFLAKLPNDGSLTGTYVLDGANMVYAASTLTAATSTLTAATSTLTAATSTLTADTSTLTGATPSLTSHIVEL